MSESKGTEYGAELTQDDAFFGEAPPGDETPGDYMSNDQSAGISEETGTVYDATGEPETTPYDEVRVEEDADDPDGPNAATSGTTDE